MDNRLLTRFCVLMSNLLILLETKRDIDRSGQAYRLYCENAPEGARDAPHCASAQACGRIESSFYAGCKLGEKEKALLWQWLQDDPECASRELQAKLMQAQPAVSVSLRHLNWIWAQWQLNRSKGRPRQAEASPSTSVTTLG